jgi:hypothetical protein
MKAAQENTAVAAKSSRPSRLALRSVFIDVGLDSRLDVVVQDPLEIDIEHVL